jgi:predicted O-methyltransferase YrrM
LNGKHVLQENVKGDIAELGVYRGNSAAILAKLANQYGRKLFLFDTFTGFDERDYAGKNDTTNDCDFTDTSVDNVRRLLTPYDAIFVKGFFPESLSQTTLSETFAIIHIDCDLAEPMRAGLETFYPLLAPGGIMILHDYGSGWWKALTKTVDEFFRYKPEKPILMPDKSGTVIIRKHSLRGGD